MSLSRARVLEGWVAAIRVACVVGAAGGGCIGAAFGAADAPSNRVVAGSVIGAFGGFAFGGIATPLAVMVAPFVAVGLPIGVAVRFCDRSVG